MGIFVFLYLYVGKNSVFEQYGIINATLSFEKYKEVKIIFEKIGKITVSVIVSIVVGVLAAVLTLIIVEITPEAVGGDSRSIGILYSAIFLAAWPICLVVTIYKTRHTAKDTPLSLCLLVSLLLALGVNLVMLVVIPLLYKILTLAPSIPAYAKVVFLIVFAVALVASIKTLEVKNGKEKMTKDN